jgi:hypothetical protein
MLRSNVVVEGIRGLQRRSDEKDRVGEARLFTMIGEEDAMAAVLEGDGVPYSGERFVNEAGAGAA